MNTTQPLFSFGAWPAQVNDKGVEIEVGTVMIYLGLAPATGRLDPDYEHHIMLLPDGQKRLLTFGKGTADKFFLAVGMNT